jgi:lipid-binding SYLF domain-containing protein
MTEHKNRLRFLNLICKASITFAVLCLLMLHTTFADDKAKNEQERVKSSGEALDALVNSESGIPTDLLNKSECVIILPSVKKGGFIIAGQYGKGLMTCRTGAKFDGPWSAPIMMQSSGGSVGFQEGGVILVLNDKGARKLMNGKAKLGADASIAAGPVGHNAEAATNAAMNAEMLSYSRTSGVSPECLCREPRLDPTVVRTKTVREKGEWGRDLGGESTSARLCEGNARDTGGQIPQEPVSRQAVITSTRNYALQNNQRGTEILCGATGQSRVVSVCAGFLS